MSSYESLAHSYDELTYDIDYEKTLAFIEKLLARYHVAADSVLDLACGTGSLSVLLAEKGYQVLGVDCSEDMLTEAAEKSADMDHAPLWICQRMEKLRLPYTVDAAVCCLDSINYVTKPGDCRETFRRVYQALEHGGLFVFDINTAYKLRGLDGQTFLDETDDTYCVWRTDFDEKKNICYYGFDLFRKTGELWERSSELHREYAYSVEELTQYLQEAGFHNIRVFGDRKLRKPSETELRVYFAAQKE